MGKRVISIIVTCHAEGVVLHHTLRSVFRSLSLFKKGEGYEVIVHADSPTQPTLDYLETMTSVFPEVKVFYNKFRDPGKSRNFSIKKATGKYIALIDGDDLMSKNWLKRAVDTLENTKDPAVAHSELTVEFEGADSLVIKHGSFDLATDTLLSVYSNRWNSVIVTTKDILTKIPYQKNGTGFGFEDWHLNNRLIAAGVRHILIPKTVIFVRRKAADSVWLKHISSMLVLKANPLLSFASVRNIDNPFAKYVSKLSHKSLRSSLKMVAMRYRILRATATRAKPLVARFRNRQIKFTVPKWLTEEWKNIHEIDRQLFPDKKTLQRLKVYDSLIDSHKIAGALYKIIVDQLKDDSYDYVLFTPWLSTGGADLFAINYANKISETNPSKRVLVMATLPVKSVWHDRLNSSVDFLDFGNITSHAPKDIKYKLVSHIIENAGVTHLHILNSEFGYDYVRDHATYIKANKKVVATSFSESVDTNGRLYGYSHTHVPFVYNLTSLITTDNKAVADMWCTEYGFDRKKIRVHRTPLELYNHSLPVHRDMKVGELRVLWAARLAPEKLVPLVLKIGELLKDSKITIDMYGTPDRAYSDSFLRKLPSNITYNGKFSGFFTLPLDQYDAFLYTSAFDGMPNTLLEAAKAGLPIVTSSVGGIPEFINIHRGILIENIHNAGPYAEALRKLADEPHLRINLANGAYKALKKNYNQEQYEKSVKEMLSVLDY